MDKKISVLLVDDEPAFIESMALSFKSKGYSVVAASNSEEALKAVKQDTPNIVFLDILMPDMDGFAVLKKIREFNRTLPVIMMSGYFQDSREQKKVNFYGASGIYYKGDDFSKAVILLESALKTD